MAEEMSLSSNGSTMEWKYAVDEMLHATRRNLNFLNMMKEPAFNLSQEIRRNFQHLKLLPPAHALLPQSHADEMNDAIFSYKLQRLKKLAEPFGFDCDPELKLAEAKSFVKGRGEGKTNYLRENIHLDLEKKIEDTCRRMLNEKLCESKDRSENVSKDSRRLREQQELESKMDININASAILDIKKQIAHLTETIETLHISVRNHDTDLESSRHDLAEQRRETLFTKGRQEIINRELDEYRLESNILCSLQAKLSLLENKIANIQNKSLEPLFDRVSKIETSINRDASFRAQIESKIDTSICALDERFHAIIDMERQNNSVQLTALQEKNAQSSREWHSAFEQHEKRFLDYCTGYMHDINCLKKEMEWLGSFKDKIHRLESELYEYRNAHINESVATKQNFERFSLYDVSMQLLQDDNRNTKLQIESTNQRYMHLKDDFSSLQNGLDSMKMWWQLEWTKSKKDEDSNNQMTRLTIEDLHRIALSQKELESEMREMRRALEREKLEVKSLMVEIRRSEAQHQDDVRELSNQLKEVQDETSNHVDTTRKIALEVSHPFKDRVEHKQKTISISLGDIEQNVDNDVLPFQSKAGIAGASYPEQAVITSSRIEHTSLSSDGSAVVNELDTLKSSNRVVEWNTLLPTEKRSLNESIHSSTNRENVQPSSLTSKKSSQEGSRERFQLDMSFVGSTSPPESKKIIQGMVLDDLFSDDGVPSAYSESFASPPKSDEWKPLNDASRKPSPHVFSRPSFVMSNLQNDAFSSDESIEENINHSGMDEENEDPSSALDPLHDKLFESYEDEEEEEEIDGDSLQTPDMPQRNIIALAPLQTASGIVEAHEVDGASPRSNLLQLDFAGLTFQERLEWARNNPNA